MNISAINANYTSFGAKYQAPKKAGKYAKQVQNQLPKHAAVKVIGVIGATAAMMFGIVNMANKNNEEAKQKVSETTPTISIIETYETEPIETQAVDLNAYYESMAIPVKPQSEWITMPEHDIQDGQSLSNIVISYAQLDKNTQYKDLIPYIERLKLENPYLIKRVTRYDVNGNLALPEYTLIYNPKQPGKLNIDSILPFNKGQANPDDIIDETLPAEPEETEPIRETSPEDTVTINDVEFVFDKGTLKKGYFGKYEGLMYDDYSVLDKKANGNTVLTQYDGQTADSNIAKAVTRDEDGKIIEFVKYNDGKAQTVTTYEYKPDTTVETVVDKTAKGKQIDEVKSVYDRAEDCIYSREFYVNGKLVATFDFEKGVATIGEDEKFMFDAGTFTCNDDVIGCERYTGSIDGQEIHIDQTKTAFIVEFLNSNGEISARNQYDAKGNFIFAE